MTGRVVEGLRVEIGQTAEKLILAGFFLFATFLGAYVIVPLPFTPVPLTLQTFFVLTGAAWLGSKWSAGVQGVYLGLGGAGMMVFAGGVGGMAILTGPTAGYLLAFVPASLMVGKLYGGLSTRSIWSKLMVFAVADLFILAAGSLWLGVFLHISIGKALLFGAAPFLPGEILKVTAAALLSPSHRI